jgi:D-alanyl-D-alanine carboxypeptidase
MTNDSQRRTLSVRTRLLSVTGVAVLASVLVWHAELAEFVGITSADNEPVVSASGAGGTTPAAELTAKPSPRPTQTTPPKRKSTPKPKPKKTSSTTPSYDESSVDGLTPKLRTRLLKAMAAAKRDGVVITITSGRRSAAKQQKLLDEAIERYGSYKAATRWVLPPEYSAHVKGQAVDIGPQAGQRWLNANGWRYGLCRRYDNEPWHFEALTTPGRKCPAREPYSLPKN